MARKLPPRRGVGDQARSSLGILGPEYDDGQTSAVPTQEATAPAADNSNGAGPSFVPQTADPGVVPGAMPTQPVVKSPWPVRIVAGATLMAVIAIGLAVAFSRPRSSGTPQAGTQPENVVASTQTNQQNSQSSWWSNLTAQNQPANPAIQNPEQTQSPASPTTTATPPATSDNPQQAAQPAQTPAQQPSPSPSPQPTPSPAPAPSSSP
ncbi:hypothetical protein LLH03_00315, partial [bacterium]|nr:hypothetical protein [bacterium]